MRCDWEEKALGEITSLITKGITPKYTEVENSETIRVLNQKCNRNFSIAYTDSRLHDNLIKRVPSEKILRVGDVLINSTGTGTAGRVAQIWDIIIPTTIDGHMLLLRCTNDLIPLYYGYAIKAQQKKIESFAEGSTGQTEINRQRLKDEITIKYPLDLAEQYTIARSLKVLDDKIELNRRINANLEQQAQAVFKHWFFDADYRLGTVSEIIEYHDSKRIPLSSRERSKLKKIYPYYGATSVMDYVDRYIFDGVYLLLGEDGTVADSRGFPVLQYVNGKFWVNNHAHVITGRNGFSVELLYLLFSLTNVQSIVTGAVQPKISQASLNNVAVVIPPESELQRLDSIIQPFFAMIRNLKRENKNLAQIRDSLLPKLISGEIEL